MISRGDETVQDLTKDTTSMTGILHMHVYVRSNVHGHQCCVAAVVQINYPNLKQIKQDSIEQARGRSHEDDLVQIFVRHVMQLGGLEVV